MRMRPIPCVQEQHEGQGAGGVLWQGESAACAPDLLAAYAGQVQVVYLDPPFFTGQRFTMRMRVGEAGWRTGSPALALTAYSDVWADQAAYLAMMRGMLETAHALLKPDGTLFLHIDTRMSAQLRLLLDDIFGAQHFLNEIVWAYQTGGRSVHHFSRKHDVLLFYRKSRQYYFDITAVPVSREENRSNHMKRSVDADGRSYRTIRSGGKEYVYYDDAPAYPGDVWQDVSHMQQKDPQRTGYDTQKPMKLLERVVLCASRPGDLVADLCFGSGTTLVAAAQHGRRFLGVDSSPHAHAVGRKRLLGCAMRVHGAGARGEADDEACWAEATLQPGIGFFEATLAAYGLGAPGAQARAAGLAQAPEPAGLDAVDQWSIGFLREGVFVPMAHAARTRVAPVLPCTLEMPMLWGLPCLCVVDILGGKRMYTWEGQTDCPGGADE